MRSYIGRRLASAIPVVLVVAVVGFVLFRLTPGDPAALLAGDNATREQIERTRQYLGLDQPLPVQFGRYLSRLAHADFGQSIFLGRPVTTAILERLEPTISLAIAAEIFAIALAVPLGLLALLPSFGGHTSVQSPVAILLPANILHVLSMSAWLVARSTGVTTSTQRADSDGVSTGTSSTRRR